jgi:thiosulfate/3-mercaptopyruvate sulfurtransferase
MTRLFAVGTLAAFLFVQPAPAGAQTAPASSPGPLVSAEWLQQHLTDPKVRIVATGDEGRYSRGHIPGARFVEHMDTVDMKGGHRALAPDVLAPIFAKAGLTDGVHVVLYGDSPMTTGWVYMTMASTGHGADISFLDGSAELWRDEGRAIETTAPAPATGTLTVRPFTDMAVDAKYVRERLQSPDVRILDVRTTSEWNNGHLPGATLILWQDLFADQRTLKFKSPEELRALFATAGVKPGQQVITYCAVGMRGSLMYFAAKLAGLPARVYVGSWQDWRSDSTNPIVK